MHLFWGEQMLQKQGIMWRGTAHTFWDYKILPYLLKHGWHTSLPSSANLPAMNLFKNLLFLNYLEWGNRKYLLKAAIIT